MGGGRARERSHVEKCESQWWLLSPADRDHPSLLTPRPAVRGSAAHSHSRNRSGKESRSRFSSRLVTVPRIPGSVPYLRIFYFLRNICKTGISTALYQGLIQSRLQYGIACRLKACMPEIQVQ